MASLIAVGFSALPDETTPTAALARPPEGKPVYAATITEAATTAAKASQPIHPGRLALAERPGTGHMRPRRAGGRTRPGPEML